MNDAEIIELTNLLLEASGKPEAWNLVVEKLVVSV